VHWYSLEMKYALLVAEIDADPPWKVVALFSSLDCANKAFKNWPHALPKHMKILCLETGATFTS